MKDLTWGFVDLSFVHLKNNLILLIIQRGAETDNIMKWLTCVLPHKQETHNWWHSIFRGSMSAAKLRPTNTESFFFRRRKGRLDWDKVAMMFDERGAYAEWVLYVLRTDIGHWPRTCGSKGPQKCRTYTTSVVPCGWVLECTWTLNTQCDVDALQENLHNITYADLGQHGTANSLLPSMCTSV